MIAALLAPSLPAVAATDSSLPSTSDGIQNLASGIPGKKPDNGTGNSSGDYTQSIPIEVPAFHGIEPDISLDYSSSQVLRYGPDGNGWLGRGWSLKGVPSIDRISRGGGAPRFDGTSVATSSDVYTIGGDELVACVTGMVSPSCQTGGNYATRIESYRRILFNTAGNSWSVWTRDGTRYDFYAAGETLPPPPADGTLGEQLAWHYRYLLRRVTDTHGNYANYAYACEQDAACRISTINYNSAEIRFYWDNRPDPMTYATGLNRIWLNQRLKSVTVRFAGQLARAYALGYDQSAITASSRLISVQQFAGDASIAGDGAVTAGATAPLPPYTFTYQNTLNVGTTYKVCQSSNTSPPNDPIFIVDTNGDLKKEIKFPTGCAPTGALAAASVAPASAAAEPASVAAVAGTSEAPTVAPAEETATETANDDADDAAPPAPAPFDMSLAHDGRGREPQPPVADVPDEETASADATAGKAETSDAAPATGSAPAVMSTSAALSASSADITYEYPERGYADFNGDNISDTFGDVVQIETKPGNQVFSYVTDGYIVIPPSSTRLGGAYAEFIGDFNGDGRDDVASGQNVRLGAYGGLDAAADWGARLTPPCGGTGCVSTSKVVADINGDGKQDIIAFANRGNGFTPQLMGSWRLSTGSSWGPQQDLGLYAGRTSGDYNGDGKADIAAGTTVPGEAVLLYSTGNGFAPVPMPAGGGGFDADLNGDGRTDSIEGVSNTSRINVSTGTSFMSIATLTTMPAGSNFVGFADLSGDGLPDIITTAGSPRGIYVTPISGTIPDLMLTAKSPLGATSQLTWRPSTDFANTNAYPNTMSFVKPVLTAITVTDGINPAATTGFYYDGGKYAASERMFLGFASVSITRPCNVGETVCPIIRNYYRQEFAAVGQIGESREDHPAGYTLRFHYENFAVNNGLPPYTALNTSTTISRWENGINRKTQTERSFDAYGQPWKIAERGTIDWTGDERTTYIARNPNTSAFIVDRPSYVNIKAGDESGPDIAYTEYRYDEAGLTSAPPVRGDVTSIIRFSESPPKTTLRAYDSFGNMIREADPLGRETKTTFDSTYHLFPVGTTNALNQTSTSTFNTRCGLVASTTDTNGLTSSFSYDQHCRETQRSLPNGLTLQSSYQNFGTPSSQFVETQSQTGAGTLLGKGRVYFDGLGRSYQARQSASASSWRTAWLRYSQRGAVAAYASSFIYDAAYASTGGARYVSTYEQDILDRKLRDTLPDGGQRNYSYSLVTNYRPINHVEVIDELGRKTTTEDEYFGHTAKTIDRVGTSDAITLLLYDVLGRVLTIQDPLKNTAKYGYDGLGRRKTAADPGFVSQSYDYDAANNLTTQLDNSGQYTGFTYDALNRVKTKTVRLGQPNAEVTTYTYDEVRTGFSNKGKLTTVSNPAGTITYDYDTGGRLVKRSWTLTGLSGTKTETYAYNAAGQLIWRGWPDGTTTGSASNPWTYDLGGLLTGIPGLVTGVTYNAAGLVSTIDYANGVRTTNTYNDARNWLMSVRTTNQAGTVLQSITYTRDAAGRIKTMVASPTPDNWTYSYDEVDRLTSAVNSGRSSYSLAYNLSGSITSNSLVGTYAYPAQGATAVKPLAPTSVGGAAYSYDGNGNLLSDGTRSFVYDGENRLVSVTTSTGTTSYVYGPDGDRVKTSFQPVGGGAATVTWQLGDTAIAADGTMTKVPFPDIRIVGSTTCFVHRDNVASIRLVTDGAASATLRQRFTPFGNLVVDTDTGGCPGEDRGFIGERRDADTGLIDLNARWYDPATALFLSSDTLDPVDNDTARAGLPVGWRTNPVGTNRYAYAGQDPINKSDPTGRCTTIWNCLTGGTFPQPDGSVRVESSVLLSWVPGQRSWDKARTSWANGDRTGAVTQTLAGVAEIGLTAATLSLGGAAVATERAVAASAGRTAAGSSVADASAASVADKLDRYLLNVDHPVGGSKAQWFQQALGFTRENSRDLAKQLVFNETEATQTAVTQYGTKFNQTIDVVGANGRTIPVTTAWIKGSDGVAKLITAYPGK